MHLEWVVSHNVDNREEVKEPFRDISREVPLQVFRQRLVLLVDRQAHCLVEGECLHIYYS